MKTRSDRHGFNMVEVVLALGVAVIGVVCVMGLLPVGLNASRDAMADNYLPDVAQELLVYIQTSADADPTFLDSLPDSVAALSDEQQEDFSDPVTNAAHFDRFLSGSLDESGGLVLQYTEVSGWFLIVQQTMVDGVRVIDFSAAAKVWKDTAADVAADYNEFSIPADDLAKVVTRVFVEISWPATIPYARRVELGNVRTYRLELFNSKAEL